MIDAEPGVTTPCVPEVVPECVAPQDKFPEGAIWEAGYGAVWQGQKSWNGVAILAKGNDPAETRRNLPGDPEDGQSRYIEAAVGWCPHRLLYLPNRESGARSEVRLQALLVRASCGLCGLPPGTPSGAASDSHRCRTERRPFTPLTLRVAILTAEAGD